jgi:hypothetical protein
VDFERNVMQVWLRLRRQQKEGREEDREVGLFSLQLFRFFFYFIFVILKPDWVRMLGEA